MPRCGAWLPNCSRESGGGGMCCGGIPWSGPARVAARPGLFCEAGLAADPRSGLLFSRVRVPGGRSAGRSSATSLCGPGCPAVSAGPRSRGAVAARRPPRAPRAPRSAIRALVSAHGHGVVATCHEGMMRRLRRRRSGDAEELSRKSWPGVVTVAGRGELQRLNRGQSLALAVGGVEGCGAQHPGQRPAKLLVGRLGGLHVRTLSADRP